MIEVDARMEVLLARMLSIRPSERPLASQLLLVRVRVYVGYNNS